MISLYEIENILRDDWLVQICSLHWSISISYLDNNMNEFVLPNIFMKELSIRIAESYHSNSFTKDEIIYLAHWHCSIMIREQYSKIINNEKNG